MKAHLMALGMSALLVGASLAITEAELGGPPVEGTLTPQDAEPIEESCPRSAPGYFRDVFSFEAAAGSLVSILLTSDFDGYLYLFSRRGEQIAENDDHTGTRDSLIEEYLRQPGTYYLVVTSYREETEGSYTLNLEVSLEEPPSVEDRMIGAGASVEAHLVPGDAVLLPGNHRGAADFNRDGYVFEGAAGQSLRIDLESDFDGILYLVGPGGDILAENDDFNSDRRRSRIVQTLETDGPHRVVVSSFRRGVTGGYTLSLDARGGDSAMPPATAPTAGPTSQPATQPTTSPTAVPSSTPASIPTSQPLM